MYITEKYWGEYMGGTDDSLTLLDYLAGKGKEEIPLGEIFADFGADRFGGNFREPAAPLVYTDPEGWEMAIDLATDFITDLAALLLECKVNGALDPEELEMDTELSAIRIPAAPAELERVCKAVADFAANPSPWDLSEMVSEEELREMAELCGELAKELGEK